jgi:hypothetical protein
LLGFAKTKKAETKEVVVIGSSEFFNIY